MAGLQQAGQGQKVIGVEQGAQALKPFPLAQGRQTVGHRHRQVLIDAGVPVAVDGAGLTAVPDGSQAVNLLQGAQGGSLVMAAGNLQVPVHEEVLVSRQARETAGTLLQLALQVRQTEPRVEDGQRGVGLQILDPAKPAVEFLRGEVHGIVFGEPQIGGLQPGDGIRKSDPPEPQSRQELDHAFQVVHHAAQGYGGYRIEAVSPQERQQVPDMVRQARQSPVVVMQGRAGGVHGNDQGFQGGSPQILNQGGGEQGGVGAQKGMDPQGPGLLQRWQQAGVKQRFPPGEAKVLDSRLFQGGQAPLQMGRIGHDPGGRRHLGKIAEAAMGVAGVGEGDLAKAGTAPENEVNDLLSRYRQLSPASTSAPGAGGAGT